jgi:hypothetical protein
MGGIFVVWGWTFAQHGDQPRNAESSAVMQLPVFSFPFSKEKTFNAKAQGRTGAKHHFLSLRLCHLASLRYVFVLLLLGACIPAKVPDNLDDTPGPPVIVNGRVYEGAQFSARYPAGWRIITSQASAPQSVVFAAPENAAVIQLQTGALDEANLNDDMRHEIRTVTLPDGTPITVILSAAAEDWATYEATFEAVLASVQGSS